MARSDTESFRSKGFWILLSAILLIYLCRFSKFRGGNQNGAVTNSRFMGIL